MKQKISVCLMFMICILLIGCGSKKDNADTYIYYLSSDETTIVKQAYEIKSDQKKAGIKEMIEELKKTPEDIDIKATISGNVNVVSYDVMDNQLDLHFDENYYSVKKSTEVLVRAAIVQTLVQIDGIDYVSFYVEDKALADTKGNPIGLMSVESFIQNTGSALYAYQNTSLKLYFADAEGAYLQEEVKEDVRYSINTSMEKLVVERLMKGPSSKNCTPTIPEATTLLGVSVRDGICYVNFSKSFLTNGYNQKPEVTIYSIVNSIIANGTVSQVQILIEGAGDAVFMESVDLSKPLEWNAEIMKESVTN